MQRVFETVEGGRVSDIKLPVTAEQWQCVIDMLEGWWGPATSIFTCQETPGNISDITLTTSDKPNYDSAITVREVSSPFTFVDHKTGETVTLHRAPSTSDEDWIRYVMKEQGWKVSW